MLPILFTYRNLERGRTHSCRFKTTVHLRAGAVYHIIHDICGFRPDLFRKLHHLVGIFAHRAVEIINRRRLFVRKGCNLLLRHIGVVNKNRPRLFCRNAARGRFSLRPCRTNATRARLQQTRSYQAVENILLRGETKGFI